ncbi:MAG TPA: hypothetical protein VM840_08805 [Actinomycetota bacterium]|nr:hypothetical protein [Actinomycetota bacterium]
MPWCPACDEIFPSGPSCPRCRTQLVEMADLTDTPETGSGGALPQLKVPRRLRRAFDRMNRPAVPPRQLLSLVLGLLVFLAGMAVGQMGTRTRALPLNPPAEPMSVPPQTALEYVVEDRARGYPDLMIVRRALDTGAVDPARRLELHSVSVSAAGRSATRLRALGGSIAALVDSSDRWLATALPDDGVPLGWLPALDVAWETPSSLLVLDEVGRLNRWAFAGPSRDVLEGEWVAVYQTPTGAAAESWGAQGRHLASVGPGGEAPSLVLPLETQVLAVGPGARSALVTSGGAPTVWDGARMAVAEIGGYEAVSAAFSPDGRRIAVTLRQRREAEALSIALVVLDEEGRQVSFDRLTSGRTARDCSPTPVWDPSGTWIYLAPGDRMLYGLQVGGGGRPRTRLGNTGCGLAWSA